MRNLVKVELYKMSKRKYFIFILAFNLISIIYGLGILLGWSWISFAGDFDVIQYCGAMWQLLFMIGIPMIFFMYIGASILGGEKFEGQMLLEITRVANRKKLVLSKIVATLILLIFYLIANIIMSVISYFFFVKQTAYATSEIIIFSKDNIDLMLACLFGMILMATLVIITMYLSIRYGAVISTIMGISIYVLMSLLSRMTIARIIVPGYYALASEAVISLAGITQQLLWCAIVIYAFILLSLRKIIRTDL